MPAARSRPLLGHLVFPDGRGAPSHTRSRGCARRVQLQLPRALASGHCLSQYLCDIFEIGSRNWRWTSSPLSYLVSVILLLPRPSRPWAPSPRTATPRDSPSHTDSTGITPPQGWARFPTGETTVPTKEGQAGAPRSLPLPPHTVPTACSVGTVPPEVPSLPSLPPAPGVPGTEPLWGTGGCGA